MILPALVNYLLNHSDVSALVGARIYPERLPESTSATPNTMPLITYQLVNEPVRTTHTNNNLFSSSVQIDAWGGSYKSANDLAAAVFSALQGYAGHMGTGGVQVGSIFRQDKRDASDPNVDLFRVVQIFTINWKEA